MVSSYIISFFRESNNRHDSMIRITETPHGPLQHWSIFLRFFQFEFATATHQNCRNYKAF